MLIFTISNQTGMVHKASFIPINSYLTDAAKLLLSQMSPFLSFPREIYTIILLPSLKVQPLGSSGVFDYRIRIWIHINLALFH